MLRGIAIPTERPAGNRPIAMPEVRVLHSGCRRFRPAEYVPGHMPHWFLLWMDRPGNAFAWDGGSAELRPDRILLVPPGLRTHPDVRHPVTSLYLWLTFGPAWDQTVVQPVVHRLAPSERRLVRILVERFAARGAPARPEMAAILALTGVLLGDIPEDAWASRVRDVRIRNALERIRADPLAPTGNRTLAADAGMELAAFLRKFRSQTGSSPQQLRRSLRLDLAAALLLDGQPIKAVAGRCGWADRSRFSTTFRQRFGRGPAAWARSFRQ